MSEEERNYENVMYLIHLIIADLKRIKYLKIPIKIFQTPDLESLFTTIIELYRKNGFVNLKMLYELSKEKKFDYDLFSKCEYQIALNSLDYMNSYEIEIDFYQNKILEYYKKISIKRLTKKYDENQISQNELTIEMNKINNFKLDVSENNDFKTIEEIPREEKEKVYIKSNINELDNLIKGFALGELTIWSGGNASSKSTFLNQLILEAINQNFNVAIYSGELKNSRLLDWLYLQACGIDNLVEKKGFYKPKEIVKQKIDYWLNDKLFVFDDTKGNDCNKILSSIKKIVKNKQVKVVVIDNLMSLENNESDKKYDMQSKLVKELSTMCKELDIHIHFVCHPRKTTTFLRKNDISGTADITNLADNVIIMHRNSHDFVRATKEMFFWKENDPIYDYTNYLEVCKNREFGVQDKFVGMMFENGSRRLLNQKQERKIYGWEQMR